MHRAGQRAPHRHQSTDRLRSASYAFCVCSKVDSCEARVTLLPVCPPRRLFPYLNANKSRVLKHKLEFVFEFVQVRVAAALICTPHHSHQTRVARKACTPAAPAQRASCVVMVSICFKQRARSSRCMLISKTQLLSSVTVVMSCRSFVLRQ